MSTHCETFLEQLAAECAAERPWNASMEAHLASCATCARLAERQRATLDAVRGLAAVGAPAALDGLVAAGFGAASRERRVLGHLSTLERAAAPADLDGLVVAACQPGFREERAVAELRSAAAAGPGAPAELDGRLEGLFSSLREEGLLVAPPAPADLAERVDQDLQDPAAALSGRLLTKLPRVDAPEVLEERVESETASRPALRLVGSHRGLAVGLAAAAALVLFVGLQGIGSFTATVPAGPEALVLDFEVQRPGELDTLSPRGRELYARLSGGLTPALGGPARVALEAGPVGGASAQRSPELDGSSGAAGGASAPSMGGAPSNPAGGGTQASTTTGGPNGAATNGGGNGALLGGLPGPEYFQRIASAPFDTAYRGERVVQVRTMTGDIIHVLEYVEDVASDGEGAFTVVPIQILDPVLSFAESAEYLMRQEAREGFFYRFRDFRIRDFAAFQLNYEVIDLGQSEIIADVSCELFQIQRRDGSGDVHRVAIDPVTALVFSEETTRPNGEVLHRMRYQTFQLDPELSDVQLNDGVSAWAPTEQGDLASVLQTEPLLPSAPPSGYELQSMGYQATVGLASQPWVQLTYGDGVDTAFFLFEDTVVTPVGNGGSQHQFGDVGDVVRVYSFGSWTMIEGRVRGRNVLAVGKVQEQELLLMLQSAVE